MVPLCGHRYAKQLLNEQMEVGKVLPTVPLELGLAAGGNFVAMDCSSYMDTSIICLKHFKIFVNHASNIFTVNVVIH